MNGGSRQILSVVSLFLGVYILPLGLRPMVTPDEFRYAEIPREMLVHQRWVVPTLNGLPYFEKPVLGYWLNAVSIGAFGPSPFSVRLPSAIASGVTALLVVWLAAHVSFGRATTALSAAILLSSLQFFGTGVFAVLDGPFTAFVTGTMVFFYVGFSASDSGRRIRWLALSGCCCGAAFLTKGFIGVVLPFLSIVTFVFFEQKLWKAVKVAWIPALAAVVAALPWSILVHIRETGFWRYFVWTEHIQRFLHPGNGQHPEPIWFFLPILVVGALPWTPVLPAALEGLRADKSFRSVVVYASCWFVVPCVFVSLSSGKLATYVLPSYPPLALLTAIGLTAYFGSGRRLLWSLGAATSALVLLIGSLVILAWRADLFEPAQQWRAVVLAAALVVGTVLSLAAARANGARATTLLALAPVFFLLSLPVAFESKPMAAVSPGGFLDGFRERVHPRTTLVSDVDTIHAVCWVFGRDDVVLLGNPGELDFGTKKADRGKRHLESGRLVDYAKKNNLEILVFAGEYNTFDEFSDGMPAPIFQAREGELVFAEFRIPRLENPSEGFCLTQDTYR